MGNVKHTPGPWRSERGSGDYGRNVTADNGRRIVCETICAEHEANARLIAAAPELLEALIFARGFIPKNQVAVRASINAAIAKAEGRA